MPSPADLACAAHLDLALHASGRLLRCERACWRDWFRVCAKHVARTSCVQLTLSIRRSSLATFWPILQVRQLACMQRTIPSANIAHAVKLKRCTRLSAPIPIRLTISTTWATGMGQIPAMCKTTAAAMHVRPIGVCRQSGVTGRTKPTLLKSTVPPPGAPFSCSTTNLLIHSPL